MAEKVDAEKFYKLLRDLRLPSVTAFPLFQEKSYWTLPPDFSMAATASVESRVADDPAEAGADGENNDDQSPYAEAQ